MLDSVTSPTTPSSPTFSDLESRTLGFATSYSHRDRLPIEIAPQTEMISAGKSDLAHAQTWVASHDDLECVNLLSRIDSPFQAMIQSQASNDVSEFKSLSHIYSNAERLNVSVSVTQESREALETLKTERFYKTAPTMIFGVAIGAGVSIQILMTTHVGGVLLSQSGILIPFDPLPVLEGPARVSKSKEREDLLFDNAVMKEYTRNKH